MLTQNGHNDLSLFWFGDIQNKAGLRPGTDLINLGTVRKVLCPTFEKLFVAYNLGLGVAIGYKCILLIQPTQNKYLQYLVNSFEWIEKIRFLKFPKIL